MKRLNPWPPTFARPSKSNSSETLHQSQQFMVGWGGERCIGNGVLRVVRAPGHLVLIPDSALVAQPLTSHLYN
jgi:hypothetical protein